MSARTQEGMFGHTGHTEQDMTVFYVVMTLLVFALFSLVFGAYALFAAFPMEWTRFGIGVILALCVFSVSGILFLSWRHWRKKKADEHANYVLAENQRRDIELAKHDLAIETARAALPAPALPLPIENRVIPVTSGENRAEVALNLICGYDARFVDWLIDYITGKGNSWAESRLEHMPLPYVFGPDGKQLRFGKAEGNTPYQHWFGVPDGYLVKTGILAGRGGVANHTGKLAMTDAAEIKAALKACA